MQRFRRAFRGGTEGNARLTATTAAVLLVLLAAEGATIPFVGQQPTLHVFLGLMLIPPVLLKLGSTGWRFTRYYLRDPAYVSKGPPRPLMRLLVAPLTVISTLALLGTGVLLVLVRPHEGVILGLHKASFIVWFVAMSVHVLGHVLKLPALLRADARAGYPGARLRHIAITGAVVIGGVVALAGLPAAHDWAHWGAVHRHLDQ